jgi:hypothetical protein
MDASSMSSAVTRAAADNQASVAVAKIALDQAKSEGQAANELIKAAADVQKASVARDGHMDVYG